MRTVHSKLILTLLIFTLCLGMFASPAFALETPSVELPVTVTLSGTPPSDGEDYRIFLKADSPDYPMPQGSEDGVFSIDIKGGDTVKLPEIQYSSIGVHTYKIYQTNVNEDYDELVDTTYSLLVYVTYAEDGSLETTVILYLLGEEGKANEVVFDVEYEEELKPEDPDKPDVPQTGDDTEIWPYIGLFISGAAMLVILGFTIKKKEIED